MNRRDHLKKLMHLYFYIWASLVTQMIKSLPAMQETWVGSLGQEDPLEEGNGNLPQYSCLENPMDRGAWQAIVHGVARVTHNHQYSWSGEFYEQRSLVDNHPWGGKESDMTEPLTEFI